MRFQSVFLLHQFLIRRNPRQRALEEALHWCVTTLSFKNGAGPTGIAWKIKRAPILLVISRDKPSSVEVDL